MAKHAARSAAPLLFLLFILIGMDFGSDDRGPGLLPGALIGSFVAFVLLCVATFTAFIVAWLWFYRLPIFFCFLILLLGVFLKRTWAIYSQMQYDRLNEPSAPCPQETPVLPTHAQPRPPSPPSIALIGPTPQSLQADMLGVYLKRDELVNGYPSTPRLAMTVPCCGTLVSAGTWETQPTSDGTVAG